MGSSGTHFPISPLKKMFVGVFQSLQMGLIGAVLFADKMFNKDNLPEWLQSFGENKLGTVFCVWVVGNIVISTISNTGAFEIGYDGQLVFSKLTTGKMPTVQ